MTFKVSENELMSSDEYGEVTGTACLIAVRIELVWVHLEHSGPSF